VCKARENTMQLTYGDDLVRATSGPRTVEGAKRTHEEAGLFFAPRLAGESEGGAKSELDLLTSLYVFMCRRQYRIEVIRRVSPLLITP